MKLALQTANGMIRPILLAAGPVIAQRFTKDCCLNATRVLIEVFRDFGIPARAMVVRCIAANAEYYRGTYRGTPAVFLRHSRIEHIFTLRGEVGPSLAPEPENCADCEGPLLDGGHSHMGESLRCKDCFEKRAEDQPMTEPEDT